MYLPPTRPQLRINPDNVDFLTHPDCMQSSFMSFMAAVTKRVINDCHSHQVCFCWHSITTSTPHQILNFVWHLKRPQAIPKFWIRKCVLLGRLQLWFHLQKSISWLTCVPSIMRVGPYQCILYSDLSQRYFFLSWQLHHMQRLHQSILHSIALFHWSALPPLSSPLIQ